MKKTLSVLCCLCISILLSAQSDRGKQKEVGINMTEMITQFVPFKGRSSISGPFALMWRSGSNGKYLNIQVGARISDNTFDDNYANLQIGFLKKRPLGEKMTYFTSQNFIVTAGGLNIPNQELGQDGSFGFSFGAGLQYELSNHLAIATETLFVLAFGDSGGINFVPPVGIFLLAKF